MAKFIGATVVSDIFLIAFKVPNSFRRILAEGAFSSVFIPFFTKQVDKDIVQAKKFAGSVLSLLLLIALLVTILCQIFMSEFLSIIAPGFTHNVEIAQSITHTARWLFLILPCVCVVAFFGGVLNVVNNFHTFAMTPIILNLSVVVGIFYSIYDKQNLLNSLVVSVLGSYILQLAMVLFAAKRADLIIHPRKFTLNKETRSFLSQFGIAILGSGVFQINVLIDTYFASFTVKATSYLYYVDRIIQLPLSLLGSTMAIAMLPLMSSAIAKNNISQVASLKQSSLEYALNLGVLISALLFINASDIVTTIYQYDKFLAEDGAQCAKLLVLLSPSLLFMVINKIVNSYFFALHKVKITLLLSILNLGLNVIINIVLFPIYGYFAIGISTTTATALSALVALFLLSRNISGLNWNRVYFVFFVNLLVAFLLFFFYRYTASIVNFSLVECKSLLFRLFFTLSSIGVQSLLYLCLLLLLGVVKIKPLLELAKYVATQRRKKRN